MKEKNETTGELWDRLSIIGAELLVETVKQIEKGVAPRIKQDSEKASIAPMIEKKDAKIDWENMTAQKIKNLASEARQKLDSIRPTSIGQALRISGVNPADISILMVYLRKYYNE